MAPCAILIFPAAASILSTPRTPAERLGHTGRARSRAERGRGGALPDRATQNEAAPRRFRSGRSPPAPLGMNLFEADSECLILFPTYEEGYGIVSPAAS
jgi:hypothetical protein